MIIIKKNLSRVYMRGKDIISRNIAGETILVPIRGNLADMQHIFTLNPVGVYIWEQLEGEKPLAAILESLLEHFEASREQATTDMLEFIDKVVETGLVTEKS
jgi:hypothetical protein